MSKKLEDENAKERSTPENISPPVCSSEKELVQKTSLVVGSPKYFCRNTGFGRVLEGGAVGFLHRLCTHVFVVQTRVASGPIIFNTDQWKREQESVGIAK